MKIKLILILSLAFAGFATAAADKPMARSAKSTDPILKQTFKTICLCGAANKLRPIASQPTQSSLATNEHGVVGNVIEKTLTFKCAACKAQFTQQAEDEFVPLRSKATMVVQGK